MKRALLFAVLIVMSAAAESFAQTAELHPGTLRGTITLSSETVQSGWVYAYSTEGGFSGSGPIAAGGTFSFLVEGGRSYRVNSIYVYTGSGRISIWGNQQSVLVPVDGTGTLDIHYATGTIAASVNVAGGTLNSVELRANADENYEGFESYGSFSGAGPFLFPAVVDSQVRVYGTAYLTTAGGQRATQQLESKTIAVGAAGGSVSWDVDLNAPDTGIAGVIEVNPASMVSQHYLHAYGQWSTPASGVNASTWVSANGPYSLFGLIPGTYSMYSYTYFQNPYGYLGRYWQEANVTAGSVTERNFVTNLGYISGSVSVNGFMNTAGISYGSVEANSLNGSSWGRRYLETGGGTYNLAVTPGDWIPYRTWLRFENWSSDPSRHLSANVYVNDYSRHHPYYGGTPVSVVAGETDTVGEIAITTVESQIILDVIEPAGQPEVLISNAQLYGWGERRNAAGQWIGSREFHATAFWNPQGRPAVRLVGEPGLYQVTAHGQVNGAQVQFGTFAFNLEVPVQTPAGSNVVVTPSPASTVTFSNVVSPGVTTVTEAPVGPAAPPNFRILSPGGTPVYYDVTTTATFSGNVRLCINYDDTAIPANKESRLKLHHYIAASGRWENITEAGSPDVAANQICGITDSFSIFAIMFDDNTPPSVTLGSHSVVEGGTVAISATATDPDGDALSASWDLDGDGAFDDATGLTITFSAASLDGPSVRTIAVSVSDGTSSSTATAEVSVTNAAPVITALTVPSDPIRLGNSVSATAAFSDAGALDTLATSWQWGDGSSSSSGTHDYLAAGVYTVTLTVTDDDGASASETYRYAVVYDPEGGFVTGGGWIQSPRGAYAADASLEGKATFGFVSKYQRGATVPTGQTQFQFHAAGMNFQSVSYEWLVIAGARAQYKGRGTINGAGEYGFLLTAIDGQVNGGGGADKFRIKIWDLSGGGVVYDNQLGSSDDAAPSTTLGGGSIVIHSR